MIPEDWARVDASRKIALPQGRDELIERYTGEIPSHQLATLFDYLDQHQADRVYIEAPYVDFDYRSEYASLYARSFNPPPDKCERLLFFKKAEFLGFCVARPSVKPVGRTAIAPPPELAPHVSCLAPHVVQPYGQRYEVEAWPFMSQDGVYGRCAHAAIWSIARYHHLRHNAAHSSISAVVAASGTGSAPDKTSPSHGLYGFEVVEAFAGLGLPALPYTPAEGLSGERFIDVICRYLNSGFPVALSTPRHLTVLIGYGYEDGEIFFVRSDDRTGAYERIPPWDGKPSPTQWDLLLVPLPARIHVPGESAEIHARGFFGEQAGASAETSPIAEKVEADEFRKRTYAVEGAKYKAMLPRRGLGADVVDQIQLTPCSGWIWVTEFQLRDSGQDIVVGEVAIDATSHPKDPRAIFVNLPGRVASWVPGEREPRAKASTLLNPYRSGLERGSLAASP